MKMKKNILSALSLLLAMVTVMCACSPSDTQFDEDGENTPEKEIVLFGGEEDYKIIYSEAANANVKDLLTQMSARVQEVTGNTSVYATDTSKSYEETPREILLGVTNRAESESALGEMSGFGYNVRFIGEKLVITASNDSILSQAVSELLDEWSVQDGKITISNKTVLSYDATDSVRPLLSDGTFTYRIVVPLKASDALYDDAVYLSQSLSAVTGSVVDICYDERITEEDGAYEICIGKTTRKISQELYAGLDNVFKYKISSDGNRIAIGALQDVIISQAVRQLYSDLYGEIKYAYSGTPIIACDYGMDGVISENAAALPMLKSGTFYGIYKSADDKYIIYTSDVSEADYNSYVNTLKADGASLQKEYSLGQNKYSLVLSDKYSAYVSYLPTENAIRTYVGPTDTKYDLNSEEKTASAATPELWQIEVDAKGGMANGGMSYVIKLTDGSFIIIDGGYNTVAEADNLYALLKENTPEGEKPTIAGWFITHLHSDHFGGLLSFSKKYAGSTDVKAFYYNFPGVSVNSSSNEVDIGSTKEIVSAMKKWKGAARYDTVHSGMRIGFAGAVADVICTHEDVYPLSFIDGNDTCTVVKITVAGQKIMFLADARDSQSAIMVSTLSENVLKSDIVQLSHHGYEGCSETFYRVVNASTVLWPMNIVGCDGKSAVFKQWYNSSLSANRYIREAQTVKKIIVSGAGTAKLTLPYTPTGERLPDYEAIYNQSLSRN